jgi:hypothetical protein
MTMPLAFAHITKCRFLNALTGPLLIKLITYPDVQVFCISPSLK